MVLEQREALAHHRRHVRALHCLVVDDNASNREIASRTLHMAGHTVAIATSAEEAIQLFDAKPFDAMFLDLHMPGTSGWSVLEHYQAQRQQGRKIAPIVVVSADANPQAAEAAREKGALAFLLKPVPIARMLHTLALIGTGVTRMREDDAEPAAPAMAWIDYLRAEGDAGALAQFIGTCLAGVDKSLRGLREADARNDVAACRQNVHELKNEFLHLAFHDGVNACQAFAQRASHGDRQAAVAELVSLAAELTERMASEGGNEPVAATTG